MHATLYRYCSFCYINGIDPGSSQHNECLLGNPLLEKIYWASNWRQNWIVLSNPLYTGEITETFSMAMYMYKYRRKTAFAVKLMNFKQEKNT